MGNPWADGSRALAICDVCGFQFKLGQLRKLVVKGTITEVKACRACWVPDQPQLMLGTFPVDDPQAIQDPRPDDSYLQSGLLSSGYPGGGSRDIQWGWAPVGGASWFDAGLTPNNLVANCAVGTVNVS